MRERGKQIFISTETHKRLKKHCNKHSFKMQGWVDMAIREKLNNLDK